MGYTFRMQCVLPHFSRHEHLQSSLLFFKNRSVVKKKYPHKQSVSNKKPFHQSNLNHTGRHHYHSGLEQSEGDASRQEPSKQSIVWTPWRPYLVLMGIERRPRALGLVTFRNGRMTLGPTPNQTIITTPVERNRSASSSTASSNNRIESSNRRCNE